MQIEDFERDLRPFADPATEVEVTGDERIIRAKLIREGQDLEITLERATGKIASRAAAELNSRSFVSFRSLLASDLFAATKAMADNQRRMLANVAGQLFIDPEGQIDSLPLDQSAFEQASHLQLENAQRPISLMLIDGPAGVGKTSLITRLVATRATEYGQDLRKPVILHVANRGRRLASFDDLVALSIQLVRARFTYDQVPALIRNGVIQIAIDGFDELVDADGYADAWSVLKDFLGEVQQGGPILLAGRDTFFDLSGFREKLGKIETLTSITHVRLASITPKSAREWLIKREWSEEDLKKEEAQDLLKDNSYALRPYFLSEVAKVGGIEQLLQELVGPREFLVRKFISREAKLITARVPLAETQAADLLRELFELIAIEMAEAETEAVDVPLLQLAVEVTFGKALEDPSDLAKLRHKAGSFALMDNDARQDFRRFPHTEISNHFLASALLKRLRERTTPRFLRRGYLGSDLMSVIGDAFLAMPIQDAAVIRRQLIDLTRAEIGFERLSENACSVAVQSLVVSGIAEPLKLSGLAAGEVVLFGTCGSAELSGMTFSRLDARGADVKAIAFLDCRVAIMMVDQNTAFGEAPPTVDHLMVEAEGSQSVLYEPDEILAWVGQHGGQKAPPDGNAEAVELLEKVARVFTRQFFIKDDESELEGRYLSAPLWKSIETILREAGRVRRNDRKDAAGRRGDFVHVVNANALLSSATEEDRDIWRKVAAVR